MGDARLLCDDPMQDAQALLNLHGDALAPALAPSRRRALQAALDLGYAAVAMPIMAQRAVKTSS